MFGIVRILIAAPDRPRGHLPHPGGRSSERGERGLSPGHAGQPIGARPGGTFWSRRPRVATKKSVAPRAAPSPYPSLRRRMRRSRPFVTPLPDDPTFFAGLADPDAGPPRRFPGAFRQTGESRPFRTLKLVPERYVGYPYGVIGSGGSSAEARTVHLAIYRTIQAPCQPEIGGPRRPDFVGQAAAPTTRCTQPLDTKPSRDRPFRDARAEGTGRRIHARTPIATREVDLP